MIKKALVHRINKEMKHREWHSIPASKRRKNDENRGSNHFFSFLNQWRKIASRKSFFMKHSKNLFLASGALIAIFMVALASFQPFSMTQATGVASTSATAQSAATFSSTYRVTTPSSYDAFTGAAIQTTKDIITYNNTHPLPTFNIWNGTEKHVVQGCVVGFGDQTIIYGSNNLNRYFRTQLITKTAPNFTPLGFFIGIHGIRKIVFSTVGTSYWTGHQGQLSMAVCVASLDGSSVDNMDDTTKETAIAYTTEGIYTTYTVTLPDSAATTFTPRWLYIGGGFVSHNLGTDAQSSKEEDLNTYYCDLVDFTAYFDGTC
jgi:hypothetical protein